MIEALDFALFFGGGLVFLGLAFLSFFNHDLLWKLYSKERGFRTRNPERTEQWDARATKIGIFYLVLGIGSILMGLFRFGVIG